MSRRFSYIHLMQEVNRLLFTPCPATRCAMPRIYANRINSRDMSRVFCDLRSQKTPRGILPITSKCGMLPAAWLHHIVTVQCPHSYIATIIPPSFAYMELTPAVSRMITSFTCILSRSASFTICTLSGQLQWLIASILSLLLFSPSFT